MTILRDAMLDLARLMMDVYEGQADATGTKLTLIDSTNDENTELFQGGTIWFRSGTNNNLCKLIDTFNGGTFTWTGDVAANTASADFYAAAPADYPKRLLKQAIISVLTSAKIPKIISTLTVQTSTFEYSLPTGVGNVRLVEIETPGEYVINDYWSEVNGKVVFDSGKEPGDPGKIIRILYMGYHGSIEEASYGTPAAYDAISPFMDLNYLKWAGAVHLLRNALQKKGNDDPLLIQFFNEAKDNETRFFTSMWRSWKLPSRPHKANW